MRAKYSGLRVGSTWNFGLVHEHLLLFGSENLNDAEAKDSWLEFLRGSTVAEEYSLAYRRWSDSLAQTGAVKKELRAAGRVLVGHGNPSGTQVGLTVHHTWGVPVVPGSALKGLLSHYVHSQYGPDDPRWRGPVWREGRVVVASGEFYGFLFGSPEVGSPNVEVSSARAGAIIFHDALYVPNPSVGPFVRDVLTVHQKNYYDTRGGSPPCDFDDPIPVGFIDIRPGTEFLVALDGPQDWANLALSLLIEALDDWGVGGKTTLGYGRLVDPVPSTVLKSTTVGASEPSTSEESAKSPEFEGFVAALEGSPVRKFVAEALDEWSDRVMNITDDGEREHLRRLLKKKRKGVKKNAALLARLDAVIADLQQVD